MWNSVIQCLKETARRLDTATNAHCHPHTAPTEGELIIVQQGLANPAAFYLACFDADAWKELTTCGVGPGSSV